ncbi:MAG: shikimate kinase [Microlunatus sp.]|nr:shikimate kinase [Microlunatus sp.]MDN5771593.1 shikimate kinase [Microlunatus sp.]
MTGASAGKLIVLVGAPGSGKSTVGRLLADQLDYEFIDIDTVIENRAGKPIAEIFIDDGEPAFRALEQDVTLGHLDRTAVVSLGGGAVTSTAIREALAGHRVVWLRVSAATAADRVGLNAARPLLLGNVRGQLIRLLAQRTPLYAEVATVEVNTDQFDAEQVVTHVLEALK